LDPSAFILALAGPGGMGLAYLAMANSKGFKDMHSSYHHGIHDWNEFTQFYADRSRHLISMEYNWFNENTQSTMPWWSYVFCHKKDYQANLAFVKSQIPNTPCIVQKVDVLQF
ncbi:hypothetical protein F3I16_20985, partial [Pseudomonas sp. L-22-4S-12]|nr:hypothetical protein [Pseudomonas sp. L-22-4S-12]